MNAQMSRQVARLRKPEVALWTLVRFVASVNAKVFGQRGTVGELLVAELARIWLLTAVRAHVGGHTGAL